MDDLGMTVPGRLIPVFRRGGVHESEGKGLFMCRSIKTLANFEPPATDEEIHASALQFVRKLSGSSKPSRTNEAAFNLAVEQVTAAAHLLIDSLHSTALPRNRDEEARKARERAALRYA
jgi:hypothetical protein